jgi:hypothetical protein
MEPGVLVIILETNQIVGALQDLDRAVIVGSRSLEKD